LEPDLLPFTPETSGTPTATASSRGNGREDFSDDKKSGGENEESSFVNGVGVGFGGEHE